MKEYKDTDEIPGLNPKRRPRTELTDEQKKAEVCEKAQCKAAIPEIKEKGTTSAEEQDIPTLPSYPDPIRIQRNRRSRYERTYSLVHTG